LRLPGSPIHKDEACRRSLTKGPPAQFQKRPPRPPAPVCELHRGYIEEQLANGMTAQVIWQNLSMELGFSHEYASVKRYVHRLKERHPDLAGVILDRFVHHTEITRMDGTSCRLH